MKKIYVPSFVACCLLLIAGCGTGGSDQAVEAESAAEAPAESISRINALLKAKSGSGLPACGSAHMLSEPSFGQALAPARAIGRRSDVGAADGHVDRVGVRAVRDPHRDPRAR